MPKYPECDKCGGDLTRCKCGMPSGLSELSPPESRSPTKVVAAVATGSLPVSSADLSVVWENRARNARDLEKYWRRQGKAFATEEAFFKGRAMAFELCSDELRREMAAANLRQPEENDQGLTYAENQPTKPTR